jgi:hypothetical protein
MGMKVAPVDPVERDLAAAQLEDIALANASRPWAAWKDIVLRWHLAAVVSARAEAWIPGLGGAQDPIVEETIGRFYRHHMRVTIGHLKSENLELRRKLVEAATRIRSLETGRCNGEVGAPSMLAALEPASPTATAASKAAQSH